MDKSNSKTTELGTVRRKANFLPTVFMSTELDKIFLARLMICFESIIAQANCEGDAVWQRLTNALEVHGLTELKVPHELTLNPLNIEITRRDGERDVLRYSSDQPMPFGFETLRLEVDRSRISNKEYLAETSAICAYMFTWRLFADASGKGTSEDGNAYRGATVETIAIQHIDSQSLNDFLRKHHRGEVSAASLSKFLIGRKIEPLINDLPPLRAFDEIGRSVSARLNADFAVALTGIEAQTKRRAAEVLLGIEAHGSPAEALPGNEAQASAVEALPGIEGQASAAEALLGNEALASPAEVVEEVRTINPEEMQ